MEVFSGNAEMDQKPDENGEAYMEMMMLKCNFIKSEVMCFVFLFSESLNIYHCCGDFCSAAKMKILIMPLFSAHM